MVERPPLQQGHPRSLEPVHTCGKIMVTGNKMFRWSVQDPGKRHTVLFLSMKTVMASGTVRATKKSVRALILNFCGTIFLFY